MKIELKIKYGGKVNFIKREIPNIGLELGYFPIDIVRHNLNDMTTKMIEKLEELTTAKGGKK